MTLERIIEIFLFLFGIFFLHFRLGVRFRWLDFLINKSGRLYNLFCLFEINLLFRLWLT